MGMFDVLFQESAVDTEKDYFEGLPIPHFAQNTSLVECGTKGMILAETAWLNISESIVDDMFVESLDEADGDNTGEKKTNKIIVILGKIKDAIIKIGQTIFGLINKFLNIIKEKVAEVGKVDERKALDAFSNLKKVPTVSCYKFNDEDKGASKFNAAINDARNTVMDLMNTDVQTEAEDAAKKMISDVNNTLVGSESIDKMGDAVAKAFGEKINKKELTLDMVKYAVKSVNTGFMSGVKAARELYKNTKKTINAWAKKCDDRARELKSRARSEKDDTLKVIAGNIEICGKAMHTVAGTISSFGGAYCQLLRSDFFASAGICMKLIGHVSKEVKEEIREEKKAEREAKKAEQEAKKAEKANEATTIEADGSLFGLDLI